MAGAGAPAITRVRKEQAEGLIDPLWFRVLRGSGEVLDEDLGGGERGRGCRTAQRDERDRRMTVHIERQRVSVRVVDQDRAGRVHRRVDLSVEVDELVGVDLDGAR